MAQRLCKFGCGRAATVASSLNHGARVDTCRECLRARGAEFRKLEQQRQEATRRKLDAMWRETYQLRWGPYWEEIVSYLANGAI